MDDLRFLAAINSIIKIKTVLKKAGKIILKWGMRNAVTCKTKAILFSKTMKQKLLEQLKISQLRFDGQIIVFN